MFLEESGIIFPFPEKKKRNGGKSIPMKIFKSLRKNPLIAPRFIDLKNFRGRYRLVVSA